MTTYAETDSGERKNISHRFTLTIEFELEHLSGNFYRVDCCLARHPNGHSFIGGPRAMIVLKVEKECAVVGSMKDSLLSPLTEEQKKYCDEYYLPVDELYHKLGAIRLA